MAPLSAVLAPIVNKTTKEVRDLRVRGLAKQIAADPALNEGVLAMMERHTEMRSPLTALLAGIAADPRARRLWEDSLDEMWDEASEGDLKTTTYPEVFIGSGLNAAIYCATRVADGHPAPLVLEERNRVGGAFAVSRTATFYLNSRNRPGGLGVPGSAGSLNFMPNAPVQPSELGFEEYQVNSDMAFAIRAALALSGAQVMTRASTYGFEIKRVPRSPYDSMVELRVSGRGTIKASRVVVGTGIGQPKQIWFAQKLLSFREFMQRLDQPFPFRKMGRVAVIGAGDSGKVVIEALTGQGPARHMSVSALDFPDEIVWYGQPYTTRGDFEQCNRSRYRKIGSLLQDGASGSSGLRQRRVRATTNRVALVEDGYDCVLVDGQPYDLAIDCTGFQETNYLFGRSLDDASFWMNGSETYDLARYFADEYGEPIMFFVGPAAKLPRSQAERTAIADPTDLGRLRELTVAAWRYSGRTAMLAQSM